MLMTPTDARMTGTLQVHTSVDVKSGDVYTNNGIFITETLYRLVIDLIISSLSCCSGI